MKQFYKSKRFWAGVIALITGLSLVFTGEKSLSDSIPEIIVVVVGIVQTILGLGTNSTVLVGSKVISIE